MSNGYPISVFLYDFLPSSSLLSYESIKQNGAWGVFHELGHNFQKRAWTQNAESEVSNNILALKCQEQSTGVPVWSANALWLRGRKKRIESFLADPDIKERNGGPFVKLAVHAQLQSVFGWELFR